MSPKLYFTPASAPCRATLMTVRAIGLEVQPVPVSLANHDHLSIEFLKRNPFHTVPTLEEDTFSVWDSHVINTYLVDRYGKNDSLYPRDLKKRAVVNQRLHFDSEILQGRLKIITTAIFKDGAKTVTKDKSDAIIQGLTLLETLLERSKFVAGESLTIADFSIIATVTTINVLIPLASNRFPKIFDWMSRMQALPYYKETNQDGLDIFTTMVKGKIIIK